MNLQQEFKNYDRKLRDEKIDNYINQIIKIINKLDKIKVNKSYILERINKLI